MNNQELEKKLYYTLQSAMEELKKLKYNPIYFIRMLNEYGAIETCKTLINQKKIHEGLYKIYTLNRLDLSMEATIYDNKEFHSLFSQDELKTIENKLKLLNYIK